MFESDGDGLDEILSQFDLPNVQIEDGAKTNKSTVDAKEHTKNSVALENSNKDLNSLPKQHKKRMIHSFFDYQSKRKFPGPAGLLSENLEADNHQNISQIVLSQDVDFSQNHLNNKIFETSLWKQLLNDIVSLNIGRVDTLNAIKQQAINGSLKRRKAHGITAFIEANDRSASDPLIILRDMSGTIKCTLHRDAWSAFSAYLASECCALVLWKPTVFTTGGAIKKHYLNITLSNIIAIYSSVVLNEESQKTLMEEYVNTTVDDFTIIKNKKSPRADLGTDLYDDLDSSLFIEDMF